MANRYPPSGEEPSFLDFEAAMENAPESFASDFAGGDPLLNSGCSLPRRP
ncbi:UNVERIFIED_CONTAM: hypothetical protein Sangu_2764000 [Sesamum angustifolium]|uniref:Uncharacterized protein n=1 Tax=Sesamum angustifolium TaxID=2727405 RepID=A0AAW2IUR1_9LAMI